MPTVLYRRRRTTKAPQPAKAMQAGLDKTPPVPGPLSSRRGARLTGTLGVVDLNKCHPELRQTVPKAPLVVAKAALQTVEEGGQCVDGELGLL